MKIKPIKSLLKEVNYLVKDYDNNIEDLEEIRSKIVTQKRILDNYSNNDINKRIHSKNLSFEEYNNLRSILKEKKLYNKKQDVINNIINRDYSSIKNKNNTKKAMVIFDITVSILAATLGFSLYKKNKELNIKEPTQITTEATTEVPTTETTTEVIVEEPTTEITTEITTEVPTTEVTTEATTEEPTTEVTTEATTEVPTTEVTTEATTEEVVFVDDIIDNDKLDSFYDTVTEFDEKMDNIEQTITDPEKREEAKENAKEKVQELIDFIFYDGEIKGVTFDELKEDQKEKIYSQLQKLDSTVEKYDPGYKERMGERYNRVKEFGSETLDKAKNKIKEKIGDDTYDKIGQIKNDTKETIVETGKTLTNYFSDKYNNWKNKEEE